MSINIYIDGSCSNNPGKGGYSIVCEYKQKGTHVFLGSKQNTTNNEMELQAFVNSLYIVSLFDDFCAVKIHTDSAYVYNSVSQHWVEWWEKNNWKNREGKEIKNRELWERALLLLKNIKNMKLIKVKGHSGDVKNEIADMYAKKARDERLNKMIIVR